MMKGRCSGVLLGMLFCVLLLQAACSREGEESANEKVPENPGFTKREMPPDNQYPHGILEVTFGEVKFRVRREYLGFHRMEKDLFTTIALYPSMLPTNKHEGKNTRQDFAVRIFFKYQYQERFPDVNDVIEKFYKNNWLHSSGPSEKYAGLVEHRKPGQWFYQVDDKRYRTVSGKPIAFFCSTFGGVPDSPATLNFCRWHIHFQDVSIRVSFKQSHLRDWRGLVAGIDRFLDQILVTEIKVLERPE